MTLVMHGRSRKMTIIRSLLNFSLNTPENLMEPTLTNSSLIRGASLSLSAASVYRLSNSFSGLDPSYPLHPSSVLFFSSPINGNTQQVTRSAASWQLLLVPPVIALHSIISFRHLRVPFDYFNPTFRFWI